MSENHNQDDAAQHVAQQSGEAGEPAQHVAQQGQSFQAGDVDIGLFENWENRKYPIMVRLGGRFLTRLRKEDVGPLIEALTKLRDHGGF